MKNYQYFFILSLLFEIVANQKTGTFNYVEHAMSFIMVVLSLYYTFKPESNELKVDIKDVTTMSDYIKVTREREQI